MVRFILYGLILNIIDIIVELFLHMYYNKIQLIYTNTINCFKTKGEHKLITGELRNKVDKVWEIFWTGGITNPSKVIYMNICFQKLLFYLTIESYFHKIY
ncbi:hypothetical protein J2Z76_001241 [Sedimentibacter acidaminivorans]|uniref:Uncharacterized protein n=1 Tax=Sedimentibacter acidaminivorans TaxID=913099 RepID=A0ABS4GCJ8_9FIRM|nr:hypothetical protein [Sedimentibacter acidaminivorans]